MPSCCFSIFFTITVTFVAVAGQDSIITKFENETGRLIRYITKGPGAGLAYEWLTTLVDDFGHRMVGSKSLEDSIDFLNKNLKNDNFDNVHTEEVPNLPHWVRGDDIVEMIEPRYQRLRAFALGGCEPADVTGEVVVIRDFEDLKHVNVSGKIVVTAQFFRGYPETVNYRFPAKYLKSEMGAVGVLVKSITSFSINSPHVGSGGAAGIPAASISTEEADMLYRLYKRGKKIKIRMIIKSHSKKQTTTSRNLIFEIKGKEFPSEVVLLSAHLDSWDVGQGAVDDGGGCAAIWSALHSLKKLGEEDPAFKPRRTIRAIFWTAEEQGYLGAQYYYKTHNNTGEKFYFVSETDGGAFKPTNWLSHLGFSGTEQHRKRLNEITELFNRFNIPLGIRHSPGQGDVTSWAKNGVPSVIYMPDKVLEYYFYFQHSEGDYVTILQDGDLEYTASIFGVLAHIIANMDDWGLIKGKST